MAKLILIRTLSGFKTAYESDHEQAKKIKIGEPYEYEYKKTRNILFHRKFFALIKLVYDNQEQYQNIEDLREDLTVEAGFYRITYNLHGEEIKKAKSINFSSMDDTEFSELYSAVLKVIEHYFKFDREEIAEEILRYF